MVNLEFFKGKRVFLTGHTGFKGSYLSKILIGAGAELTGYSLAPPTLPSIYDLCNLKEQMISIIGDVRDLNALSDAYNKANPEIVLHLAAQPLVRDSYENPQYTYETNVMGTVNLLECVRLAKQKPLSVLNVTTDKVYFNNEWVWGYRETDPLDGFDPYSNSKSCSELVTHSYINSFFKNMEIPVSTARAGNVIGGGDFSKNRILPDCVRAVKSKKVLEIRNPHSIRPYQHVLEPLFAYLMIVEHQANKNSLAGYYNVGPDDKDCITTGVLVSLFESAWGQGFSWENKSEPNAPHEAGFLKLDCSKLKTTFNWAPKWSISDAVLKTVEWTQDYIGKKDLNETINKQIKEYIG